MTTGEHGPRGDYRTCKAGSDGRACRACKDENARRAREYRARKRGGKTKWSDHLDPQPVFDHLTLLRSQGVSYVAIANFLLMCDSHLRDLAQGDAVYVTRDVAERILACRAEEVIPYGRRLPAERYRQRVRSMVALGWSFQWIGEQWGMNANRTCPDPRAKWVSPEKAAKIDALAEKVGDQWGPCERSKRLAASKGWHVPGAYDDDGRLIPGAVRVDEEAEAMQEAREQRHERRRAVLRMYEAGLETHEIAERLGVTKDVVVKDRARYGELATLKPTGREQVA